MKRQGTYINVIPLLLHIKEVELFVLEGLEHNTTWMGPMSNSNGHKEILEIIVQSWDNNDLGKFCGLKKFLNQKILLIE